jgi:protein disulfide-isomerase
MRAALRLTLVGLLVASLPSSAFAQGGIPWLYDLAEAQQLARQHQRLLLVHFYSDTCPPCRKLEQNVFVNPDVHRAMAANYIPVKINGDRSRNIAVQFQVDRWPMDVIADPAGRVLYKTVSPQDPARYVQLLNAVAADFRAATAPAQVAGGGGGAGTGGGAYASAAYDNRSVSPQMAMASPGMPPQLPQQALSADPYAPQTPAAANYRSPAPQVSTPVSGGAYSGMPPARQAADAYASQYAPPQTQTALQGAGYDPRSAWGGPTAIGGAAPDETRPPASPALNPPPTNRPAWQENRFVANQDGGIRGSAERGPAAGWPRAEVPGNSNAPAANPIGLDGFCPVTLQEQERWSKGDARWGAVHRGATYLFLSQEHQQRFLADPDRYSPVLSGWDPARYVDRGELVTGQRAHGMWFRGKIYLFADEQSLNRFYQAPEYYAQRADEIMATAVR